MKRPPSTGFRRLLAVSLVATLTTVACDGSSQAPPTPVLPSGPAATSEARATATSASPSTTAPTAVSPSTASPPPTLTESSEPTTSPPPKEAVLLAAGDIGSCEDAGDEATAELLERVDGIIATLGDNAYEDGTLEDFSSCYDPTWGRFLRRTRPSAGNHDYHVPGAAGYFEYFGRRAGSPSRGYYSYDAGEWHIVVLNSNCQFVGGCEEGSRQYEWLRRDLARNESRCTLAYWHHPYFTSGTTHGDQPHVRAFWDVLYEHGAEIVLSAHEHNYERFAEQRPDGTADPDSGIRQFVVGTGGGPLYEIGDLRENSENSDDEAWGVLRLFLHPNGYEWEFIPVDGATFVDVGNDVCH